MKLVNPNEKVLAQCKGYKSVKVANEEVRRDEKIILTDERMYFLVDELGKVCKYVDNKKISRIFFDIKINALIVESEDVNYPFEIVAEEADLRALCKAFKQMKKDRKIPMKRDLFYYSPIMTILSEEPSDIDMSIFEEKKDYNTAAELAKNMDGINAILESEEPKQLTEEEIRSEILKTIGEEPEKKEDLEGKLKIDTNAETKDGLFQNETVEKPKERKRLFFKNRK